MDLRRPGSERERRAHREARLKAEGYGPPPSERNGVRLQDVLCFKCGWKIAEVERAGPEDVILLPPDQAEYTGPLPHPWTIVVWCKRCRERRALIQSSGPPPPEDP